MSKIDWHNVRNIIHDWVRDIPPEYVSVQMDQVSGLYSRIRVEPHNPHACPVEFLDYGENAGVEITAGAFHVENKYDMEDIKDDLKEILNSIQCGRITDKLYVRRGSVVSRCAEITLSNGKKIGSLDKRYWFGLIPVEIKFVQYEPFLMGV